MNKIKKSEFKKFVRECLEEALNQLSDVDIKGIHLTGKLSESLFDSFEQYLTFGGGRESSYVEVFKNPNLSEFKDCASDGMVGALLHEKDIYTWNRDTSYHSTIMNRLYKRGIDIKNTLPVLIYVVRGNEVEIMITDASKFTKWHHNPNVAKFINHHPFFQFKKVINIIYYDQDIVGDWSEKSSMKENIQSQYVYHITAKKNLKRMKTIGITPSIPTDEIDERAVYLFKDEIEAEDALMNWLGDRFPEDEPLIIMTIKTDGLSIVPGSAGFEVMSYNAIPWKNVVKVENI